MITSSLSAVAVSLITLSWLLAIIPALVYPFICWAYWRTVKHKRFVIQQLLDPIKAKNLYIRAYAPVAQTGRDPFASLFDVTYHLPSYILAILMNSFFVFMAALVSLARAGLPIGLPTEFEKAVTQIPLAVIAGLVGAYLWGIYEILRKYWSAELSSISLHFIWVQLLLSAALGALVEATFKEETFGILAAFGIGALPLSTLLEFVREQARTRLKVGVESKLGEEPTLHKLQGLTKDVIDRLYDEGIDSTSRLAYADPIRLLLRTNFEWKVILDMVDQAALYIYVGDKATKLRSLGIRGAMEMGDAWDLIKSEEYKSSGESQRLLSYISTKLDHDEAETRNLLTTLDEDTHFSFIRTLWNSEEDLSSQSEEVPTEADVTNADQQRGKAVAPT